MKELLVEVTKNCRHLPADQKLAPRHVKEGTLDLTAAVHLVENVELHAKISKACELVDLCVPGPHGTIPFAMAISSLFRFMAFFYGTS